MPRDRFGATFACRTFPRDTKASKRANSCHYYTLTILRVIMDDNEKLLKEYHERNIRWTNESLKQLSFFNNLLLTISVAFLTFTFKSKDIVGLRFTFQDIDWSLTFLICSLWLVVFSVITGLILTVNRLQDFNVTRKVNQIRQRMLEHSEAKLNQSTPETFDFWRRLTLAFQNHTTVTMEDCKNYKSLKTDEQENIKYKFRELRNIAHNLGLNTWRNTKLQTLYFGLSIIMYLMSLLINK